MLTHTDHEANLQDQAKEKERIMAKEKVKTKVKAAKGKEKEKARANGVTQHHLEATSKPTTPSQVTIHQEDEESHLQVSPMPRYANFTFEEIV